MCPPTPHPQRLASVDIWGRRSRMQRQLRCCTEASHLTAGVCQVPDTLMSVCFLTSRLTAAKGWLRLDSPAQLSEFIQMIKLLEWLPRSYSTHRERSGPNEHVDERFLTRVPKIQASVKSIKKNVFCWEEEIRSVASPVFFHIYQLLPCSFPHFVDFEQLINVIVYFPVRVLF